MFIMMKRFPKIIDRSLARFSSRIQQAHYIGLQVFPDRVEQPTMRIDLLCVLLFEAENELNGD